MPVLFRGIMKKIKIRTIIFFIIYLAMLIFFTYECFQDSNKAGSQAGFVSEILAKVLGFIRGKEVTIDDNFRYYVSKIIGHYSYFVILGTFSILFYMSLDRLKDYIRIILHFGIGITFAFLSEFIAEALTSGRNASIKDVGIDTLGLITVSVPYIIIYYIIIYKRKKNNFYHNNAESYINDTKDNDMSKIYEFFEKYLKDSSTILDIGFGSARDLLHFKEKGYNIYGIDKEEKFVKNAKELGLTNIYQMDIENINLDIKFDALWASASLLHIARNNLYSCFKKLDNLINDKGIIYASFKYGNFSGIRDNRYYNDLTENDINIYLENTNLKVEEVMITEDVRKNNNTKWLNLILSKK